VKQPLKTVSVVDAATSRLRDSLFAGEYAAGEVIKDTEIAEEFGIARPTARVAVQHLINERMLVRLPGYSARVRTFDAAQVHDLYRVRRLLELDAVREIKAKGVPLPEIADALEGFAGLKGEENWTRIAEADVRFHSAVVNSAGSPRLQSFFAGITSETRLLIALLKQQYRGGAALYDEHEELYRRLVDDTPVEDVERAWVDHLDSAQEFLETHLSER